MSYFTEFIIHELSDLININYLLNTTVRFKEYKEKYFYWNLNQESSVFRSRGIKASASLSGTP